MRHAIGIPELTKSCFGKIQSYEVLTPDRQYEPSQQIDLNYLLFFSFYGFIITFVLLCVYTLFSGNEHYQIIEMDVSTFET